MKRKIRLVILSSFLTLLFIFVINNSLLAQSNQPYPIQINAGTFSLGVMEPPINEAFTISFFLAPSVRIDRSEIMLGPLWSRREPYQYDNPKFRTGFLLGYKLHVLKEPRWFQFNLEYNTKLVRWSGNSLHPNHQNSYYYEWKSIDLHHFIGYGMTIFLAKNKKLYIFHSLGYGWTRRLASSEISDDTKSFYHFRYNAGIGFQIYKRSRH